MKSKVVLCHICKKTDVTHDDPEMEYVCAGCWEIINGYDFLAWCDTAAKKGWKIDRKRQKQSIKLVDANPEAIARLQKIRADKN